MGQKSEYELHLVMGIGVERLTENWDKEAFHSDGNVL